MAMNGHYQLAPESAPGKDAYYSEQIIAPDNDDVNFDLFIDRSCYLDSTPAPELRNSPTPDLSDGTATEPEPAEVLTPEATTQRPTRPQLLTTESKLAQNNNANIIARQVGEGDSTGISPGNHDPWSSHPATAPATFGGWADGLGSAMGNPPIARASTEMAPIAPVISKKRPSRTQTNLSAMVDAAVHRNPSNKRARLVRIDNGFPCEGCEKMFHRECDRTKHNERKHRPESWWPHECLYCEKRSQYPKDVWRHLEQTHHMKVPAKEPQSLRKGLGCPCCSKNASAWLEANNRDESASAPPSPSTHNSLWSLTRSILQFKKLSIRVKREAQKFVFATTDSEDFKKIDVTGLSNARHITSRIAATLDLDGRIDVHRFTLKRGKEQRLSDAELVKVVADADGEGTLRLFVAGISTGQACNDYFETPANDPENVFAMFLDGRRM